MNVYALSWAKSPRVRLLCLLLLALLLVAHPFPWLVQAARVFDTIVSILWATSFLFAPALVLEALFAQRQPKESWQKAFKRNARLTVPPIIVIWGFYILLDFAHSFH